MPLKHFITFGNNEYYNSVIRICKQAKSLNTFDVITGVTDSFLKKDKEFWNKHGFFIENNKRGYGYWLWKSYTVKKKIELMNDDDVLVYSDSGSEININGKERLDQYFQMVNQSEYGNLSFSLKFLEKMYTKMDLINHLDFLNETDTEQLIATTFVLRKCSHTVDLVNKWYETCCNYHMINDSPSIVPNDPTFIDHRHDQSVFSILRKKYGTLTIPDETYFINWNEGSDKPILAKRIKG
jgi:hypothetical protein